MKKTTQTLMVVVAAVLVIYDVFAYVYGGAGATISEVVYELSSYCAAPFAFGGLAGHLFWAEPLGRSAKHKFYGLGVLVGLVGVLAVMEWAIPEFHGRSIFALALGVFAGRFLWPQSYDRPR